MINRVCANLLQVQRTKVGSIFAELVHRKKRTKIAADKPQTETERL
jgi:hypothetical protein